MNVDQRYERRRRMAKRAPRDSKGGFIREGYPFNLHDWMENNRSLSSRRGEKAHG